MTNISSLEPNVRNAHSQFIARMMGLEPVSIPYGRAERVDIQNRLDLVNEVMLGTLQYILIIVGDLNANVSGADGKIDLLDFGSQTVDSLNEVGEQFRKLLEKFP